LATEGIKDPKRTYCIIEFDQNGVVLYSRKESDPSNPEWKSKAKLYFFFFSRKKRDAQKKSKAKQTGQKKQSRRRGTEREGKL